MSAPSTPPAKKRRAAPPSSLDQHGWSMKPAAVTPRAPRPRPRPAPLAPDEGKPRLIQQALTEDQKAGRSKLFYLIAEIAVVALAVLAAILLVVGGWWMFRG